MAAVQSRIEKLPFLPRLMPRLRPGSWTRSWGWKGHLLELSIYIGAYFVYLFTRGLVFPHESTALENARRIISLQKSLGIFWEPNLQAWTLEHVTTLVVALNWAYILTYWPVILALALVLYVINRRRYYYYRTVITINLAFALLVFMLLPVASPFKTPYLTDTIQALGPTYYGSEEMAAYYNTNAAMPSLHFSWTVILGVLLMHSLRGWARLLGLLYPVVTFFAITITGNHFILDAVAGGLLAAVSFGLVELGRWLARKRRQAFTVRRWLPVRDGPAPRREPGARPPRPPGTVPAELSERDRDEGFALAAARSDRPRWGRR